MNEHYLSRSIERAIVDALRDFPSLILTGPRQSGKTTLLRHLLGGTHQYVSLEDFDNRELAISDPKYFLNLYKPPVIFDEVQYAPKLLSGIKFLIDEDRHTNGQYVLTGSQNLLLMEKVTETLVGRAAIVNLLPLSSMEKRGRSELSWPWERDLTHLPAGTGLTPQSVAEDIFAGGFPGVFKLKGQSAQLWFQNYLQTYIERDVRQIKQITDQPMFHRFMRILATRSGQLLNLASVAHDIGLSSATVREWLAILMVSHHVVLLAPYYANIGKSLVKTSKLYFTDTGLLCHLLGIQSAGQLATHLSAGQVFETAVFSELYKSFLNRAREPRIYFWRTEAGTEVDFVMDLGGRLVPLEAKFTATPFGHDAKTVRQFLKDFPAEADTGWVIHAGERMGPMGKGIWGYPYAML